MCCVEEVEVEVDAGEDILHSGFSYPRLQGGVSYGYACLGDRALHSISSHYPPIAYFCALRITR